jgi:FAD:protein FMN transferase
MGTRCEIRVFAPDAQVAVGAIAQAVEAINALEQKYSRYRPGNFMHQLNAAARQGGSFAADAECLSLLNFADICHQQSEGLFDITSGILRQAWDFERSALPDSALLERLLASVGWQHVRRSADAVHFGRAGMELDFGGIVKEYAVDRAAEVCRRNGIAHGVVDMGGDIAVIGPSPDGEPWSIGIRHPRLPGQDVATFAIAQGALATSGDYERCIEIDGKRYSHILSPRDGWPVQGLSSVTVVADQCILAGSVSTTAMLKETSGPDWLEALGLPHVWVGLDGTVGGSRPGAQGGASWQACENEQFTAGRARPQGRQ